MSPLAQMMREIRTTPRDVHAWAGGPRCPQDNMPLSLGRPGWRCQDCRAVWNYQGRRGQWLLADDVMAVADAVGVAPTPTPAPSRSGLRVVVVSAVAVLAAVAVAAVGYSTGVAYRGEPLPVSDGVLYALAVLILVAGGTAIVWDVRRGGGAR